MAAVQSTGNDENQNLSTKESIATFQNTTDTPKEIQNQEIIKSLKLFLEFCVGNNENLTDITAVVNQSYPNATAIEIHECLVKAFPDLQAQQSNEQNEVYYLGIKFAVGVTTEEKVVHWMKQRFCEDEFGSISSKTLIDIIMKEIGSIRMNRLGSYIRKAFPKTYLRRSDRIRWYCGLSLPEKELTAEDKKGKIWLQNACRWLRENLIETPSKKEKCSLIYSALSQNIGKCGGEKYMAAVKVVYPNIQKKVYDHQAFYDGIQFKDNSIREAIKVFNPVKCYMSPRLHVTNEMERNIVEWLKEAVTEKDNHREKLVNFKNLLQVKLEVETTDKMTLMYLRKTFQNMKYRKRQGVSYIYGIEITPEFKPKDVWTEKSILWIRQVFEETNNHSLLQKLQPFLDVIKDGLSCTNTVKCFKLLELAFPKLMITKSAEGRIVSGIRLIENFDRIKKPVFNDSDYYGDFTQIECKSKLPNLESFNNTESSFNNESFINSTNNPDQVVNDGNFKKLEEKMDVLHKDNESLKTNISKMQEEMRDNVTKTNNIIGDMTKEMRQLHEEINQSTRQRDTLIVQLQQTLMLLSQQQYQKMMQQQNHLAPPPSIQSSIQSSNPSSSHQDIYNDNSEHMMTMQALQNLHDNGINK